MPIFLFVSEDCDYCTKLKQLIDRYYPHNDLIYVVVDDMDDDQLPEYLEKTPTLLEVSEKDSTDSTLYSGKEVFDWLYRVVRKLHGGGSAEDDTDQAPKPVTNVDENCSGVDFKYKIDTDLSKEDAERLAQERMSMYKAS
jgi:glutaredoxin